MRVINIMIFVYLCLTSTAFGVLRSTLAAEEMGEKPISLLCTAHDLDDSHLDKFAKLTEGTDLIPEYVVEGISALYCSSKSKVQELLGTKNAKIFYKYFPKNETGVRHIVYDILEARAYINYKSQNLYNLLNSIQNFSKVKLVIKKDNKVTGIQPSLLSDFRKDMKDEILSVFKKHTAGIKSTIPASVKKEYVELMIKYTTDYYLNPSLEKNSTYDLFVAMGAKVAMKSDILVNGERLYKPLWTALQSTLAELSGYKEGFSARNHFFVVWYVRANSKATNSPSEKHVDKYLKQFTK